MKREDIIAAADKYLEEHWPAMVDDIAKLVEIPSFEELDAIAPGEPYGPGPAAALAEALKIADSMGFETMNLEGHVGFADMKGETDTQIGIIGHMDVVPAGPGWHFQPYDVSIKENFLVGRGVLDDKGPSMMALHAMKCLADTGESFPYTVRFIFGANEETGMMDVAYYRDRYEDPAFLFTPDAEFPVCYGEKGGFDATITSAPIEDPRILEFQGGAATNAVPGQAHARVIATGMELPDAPNIKITWENDHEALVEAQGKSAHAATPEEGVNAIGLIVDYLLAHGICNDAERTFLEFDKKLLDHTDGSGIGIKTSDEFFGPLTVIGGTMDKKDGCFVQTMDCRFPTSITPEEIVRIITSQTDPLGAKFENTLLMPPFLVKPDTPAIQALLKAYNDVTGQDAKPFTIGGGTYAREFTCGASFGPEMPWVKYPDWVGGIHGPDEGVPIDQLQTAFRIYVLALYDLMQIDL